MGLIDWPITQKKKIVSKTLNTLNIEFSKHWRPNTPNRELVYPLHRCRPKYWVIGGINIGDNMRSAWELWEHHKEHLAKFMGPI